MSTVPRPKRKTESCPCGSGKQYRYCHGLEQEQPEQELLPKAERNPGRVFLWLVGVGVPLAVVAAYSQGAPEDTTKARVWSAEHGHYHTVDGKEIAPAKAIVAPAPVAAATATPGATPAAAAPGAAAPPGPVPPGKEWSAEHGHWHDAKGAEPEPLHLDPSNGMPWDHKYELKQPEGEAPDGMTWSAAHGHWHPNG